jgi:hypothetical protein
VNAKWPLLLLLIALCGGGIWWMQSEEPGDGPGPAAETEDPETEIPESPDLIGDVETPIVRAQREECERVEKAKQDVERRRKALTEGAVKQRLAALKEVAALRKGAVAYLDEVIACAWHEDRQVRGRAAGLLTRIGEPAVKPFVEKLVARFAAQADQRRPSAGGATPYFIVRRLGPTAYSAIVAAMEHPHMARFADQLFSMANSVQESFASAVPELRDALSSENVRVRYVAAEALGDCGAEAAAAVPALVGLLQSDDVSLRRAVIESLGKIGPPAASAMQDLERHLERSDLSGDERRVTQYSLRKIRGE